MCSVLEAALVDFVLVCGVASVGGARLARHEEAVDAQPARQQLAHEDGTRLDVARGVIGSEL
jgi:hypothetical protein